MKFTTKAAVVVLAGLSLVACASASPSTGVVLGKKIAFLVSDASSDRFETKDKVIFETKLRGMCSNCEVIYGNANQDGAVQLKQANSALAAGAGTIVLDAVDAQTASAIGARATKLHVPLVAYDRLIMNTDSLSYFVGFDSEAIGRLQASSLLKQLSSKSNPTIVMVNGDADDAGAQLVKKGAHSVLDAKVTVANEFDVPASSAGIAQLDMSQALTGLKNTVDGVYAASDNLATGAILALKEAKVSPLPVVTGGDARLDAIQRIVAGEQYMTVYSAIKQEAEAAAQLAYELAYGVPVPAAATGGKTINNGAKDVPSVVLKPVEVTRKTLVSTILADGLWTRTDICTASYTTACRQAGISG
jgi:D-xylose transport system substrate-binding protein